MKIRVYPKSYFIFERIGKILFPLFRKYFKNIIAEKAKKSLPADSLKIKNFELIYGTPKPDLNSGTMSLKVNGSIVFTSDIKEKDLTAELLGKDENALKSFVFTLPGLEKAKISLWPFWVKKVPAQLKKIEVIIK